MERRYNSGYRSKNKEKINIVRGYRGGRPSRGRGFRGRPPRGRPVRSDRYGQNAKNHNSQHKNKNNISLSLEILINLNNKDDNEMIQMLFQYQNLLEAIDNTNFNSDMIDIMIQILMKLSKINSTDASNILYQILKNTKFNDNIIQRLAKEEYDNDNYLNFILNLISLNDKLIDKYTDDCIRIKSGEISQYVDIIIIQIDKGIYKDNLALAKEVVSKMELLKEKEKHKKLVEYEEKSKQRENDSNKIDINDNINNIRIDYKKRDIYLSTADFNENKEIAIAPHIKSGSYISYERYINTMFYLEYQDCYKDLKETMNYLQLNKSINYMDKKELYQLSKEFSNIYFYLEGEIKGLEIDRDGAVIIIEFKTHLYKNIKFTKRMITGSLVILTDNNFENYLLTTVFYNPYVDKKINDNPKLNMWIPKFPYYRVKLSLININQESIAFIAKNRQHLQIFESKAYFESYVHVMKRLKEINVPYLPFKKELIDADFGHLEMGYQYFLYNNKYLQPYEGKYPKEFIEMFDRSQLVAIHKSLINKIALIQGPPGTGKTHVGTVLTNILLQNMHNDAQILVVCFTNHALDSFIEGILNFTDSVVRIGGRCQNEKVAQYILDNKRKYSSPVYRNIAKSLDSFGENLEDITTLIDCRRRVSIGLVKKYFQPLFQRVINDFFSIIVEAIPKEYKEGLKYNFNENLIYREIYIFWNLIDNQNKKNKPDNIVSKLLNSSNITNKNIWIELYNKMLDNFIGYDEDNLDLLKDLNSTIIVENEKIEINNPNKQNEEEEEEEEDDEEELAQNLERMNYLDIDLEDKKDNINNKEEEELYDENIEDLNKMKPLDTQKYNYLLKSKINFFKIGPKVIKLIINYMKNKLISDTLNEYNKDLNKFSKLLDKKKEILISNDAEAIKNYKIVAMTTTGCAKYSTILEQSNFEIIIIEEAAEVLESHILSTLTKNTKKLILIGDHKQLRPKPYNYEIEVKYNFNISMFERLINNGIPYSSLTYQRRMKPKFAEFVRIIYGEAQYKDHEDVLNRPDVLGVEKDMFFISHNKFEGENSGLKSKFNDYEAKYLVRLCKYLLQQGYKSNQITILTFYLGQVLRIKKFLKENISEEKSKEIRVSSVDNYQGEECDIILLSLVRSNKENKIGFLKTFNRVCVAFSRAKIGFYIIGNINNIIKGETIFRDKNKNNKNFNIRMLDVWKRIEAKAKDFNIIGDKLTLICQNHKNKTIIENEKDFAKCPEGGCQEMCKKRMECGHVCEKVCHVYDCNKNKCLKPCARINKNCRYKKHQCNKLCYQKCGACEFLMDKLLPCGHIQKNVKCCDEPTACEELVDKTLRCGHVQRIKCCEKPKICEELVDKTLSCGHVQKNIKCYANPKLCEVLVDKKLICGHIQRIECYKKPRICEELTDKKLRCGHIQKNVKCCDRPKKCQEIVQKRLPCGHVCEHCFCYEKPADIQCLQPCNLKLKCGHNCQLKCYEDCDSQKCHQLITYIIPSCNHANSIECYLTSYPSKIVCTKPCLKKLPCGHICLGTCGTCLKGTLHIRCNEICEKKLVCGHYCDQACSYECICLEKCGNKCGHTNCKNKCYEECQKCEEKCSNKCQHSICMKKCGELCDRKPCNKACEKILKCGHQCYGLCGERCPDICEICKPYFLNTEFSKGTEKFYTTFCGHLFKLKDIDALFNRNNIESYKCPECNAPLFNEPRYQNKIKTYYKDIERIKKESYDKNLCIGNISYYIETENIVKKIIEQYKTGRINIFDILSNKGNISYDKNNLYIKLPVIYSLIKKFISKDIFINSSFYHLMTLAEKFMGIEYYIFLIYKDKKMKMIELDFIKNYKEVKKLFEMPAIQFNEYFFNELKRKIDNMIHYTILRIKKQENSGFNIFSIFGSKPIIPQDIDKSYFSLNLNLKQLYPYALDNIEKKIIFKSLKSKWFKCQNDHLYTADEVSSPNNDNSCPYCSFSEKAFIWMKKKIGI